MQDDKDLVLSAIGLRKLIGWLGAALPALCFLCSILAGAAIGASISAYYFTGIHGFFTGILCGLGVCLFSYKGFNQLESNLATFGGLAACGVALCPTYAPSGWGAAPDASLPFIVASFAGPYHNTLSVLHGVFACSLFVTFMVFAGALFTRTERSDEIDPLTLSGLLRAMWHVLTFTCDRHHALAPSPSKHLRNGIYRTCARLIALAIVMVMVEGLLEMVHVLHSSPFPQWVFVWEVVAIWAFAFSWLTKAESFSFVKDKPGGGELDPAPEPIAV